jgi:hypothetical protein
LKGRQYLDNVAKNVSTAKKWNYVWRKEFWRKL